MLYGWEGSKSQTVVMAELQSKRKTKAKVPGVRIPRLSRLVDSLMHLGWMRDDIHV